MTDTTWSLKEGAKEPIICVDIIPKLGIQIMTGGEYLRINRLCKNNTKFFNENHAVHDLEKKYN